MLHFQSLKPEGKKASKPSPMVHFATCIHAQGWVLKFLQPKMRGTCFLFDVFKYYFVYGGCLCYCFFFSRSTHDHLFMVYFWRFFADDGSFAFSFCSPVLDITEFYRRLNYPPEVSSCRIDAPRNWKCSWRNSNGLETTKKRICIIRIATILLMWMSQYIKWAIEWFSA